MGVPAMAELYKKKGLDPKKIVGVTILPLFSQDKIAKTIDADKIADLDKRVQDAGTEVVNAKAGKGSATLSMAYAGAKLGGAILAGLQGKRRIECAYVMSDVGGE